MAAGNWPRNEFNLNQVVILIFIEAGQAERYLTLEQVSECLDSLHHPRIPIQLADESCQLARHGKWVYWTILEVYTAIEALHGMLCLYGQSTADIIESELPVLHYRITEPGRKRWSQTINETCAKSDRNFRRAIGALRAQIRRFFRTLPPTSFHREAERAAY